MVRVEKNDTHEHSRPHGFEKYPTPVCGECVSYRIHILNELLWHDLCQQHIIAEHEFENNDRKRLWVRVQKCVFV